MVVAGESRSGEEQLLEKVRAGVAAVEVFCTVEGDVEGRMAGSLGAVYPDGGPVEG